MERKNKKVKQRGNGEGTLYWSEALQKYVAQYVEPSGKRKTLTQKKNEKVGEFKKRFTDTLASINNGTYIESSNISLYTILDDYIENKYKTGITSARTYMRDKDALKLLTKCCKNYIYKPIQKVSVHEIKNSLPNFVELEVTSIKTNKKHVKLYSQNVIDKLYSLLRKGFQIATSERIILYNITDSENIKKPKTKKEVKKVEALSVEEEKKLISILKKSHHEYKNIILLALYTRNENRRNLSYYKR